MRYDCTARQILTGRENGAESADSVIAVFIGSEERVTLQISSGPV